jgi:hypothetical protein
VSLIAGVDENVHLLADEERNVLVLDAVDDLEDTRIDSLRAIAGEGFLGYDERLESNEGERSPQISVASHGSRRPGLRLDARPRALPRPRERAIYLCCRAG